MPPGQVAEAKEDSVPPGQVAVGDTIGAHKRARMLKEIESLQKDNEDKSERDRVALWRKLQKFVSRNDGIAIEYVPSYIIIFSVSNSPQGLSRPHHFQWSEYKQNILCTLQMMTNLTNPIGERNFPFNFFCVPLITFFSQNESFAG